MKKLSITLAMIIFTVMLTACGGGSENSLAGKYMLSSLSMFGEEINYADISLMEMENSYVEFTSSGATLVLANEVNEDFEVDEDAGLFVSEVTGEEIPFILNGDALTLTLEGESFHFTLESSDSWEEIKAQESVIGDMLDGMLETAPSDFISPTTQLTLPSQWEGVLTISDYSGNSTLISNGAFDIVGYIDEDGTGTAFFEFYLVDDLNSAFLSTYIELDTDFMYPIIGVNDAWVHNLYLSEDDELTFSHYLYNGAIDGYYYYDFDGESFYMEYILREVGTPWDEMYDSAFPSYYIQGSNAQTEDVVVEETAEEETTEEEANSVDVARAPMAELREMYDAVNADLLSNSVQRSEITYDRFVNEYFNGYDGVYIDGEDGVWATYYWYSSETETSMLTINFKLEDGASELTLGNMSIANIP